MNQFHHDKNFDRTSSLKYSNINENINLHIPFIGMNVN